MRAARLAGAIDETPAHGASEQTYGCFLFRRPYKGGLGGAERPVKPPRPKSRGAAHSRPSHPT
jgi:hypothetical protein